MKTAIIASVLMLAAFSAHADSSAVYMCTSEIDFHGTVERETTSTVDLHVDQGVYTSYPISDASFPVQYSLVLNFPGTKADPGTLALSILRGAPLEGGPLLGTFIAKIGAPIFFQTKDSVGGIQALISIACDPQTN